MQTNLVVQNASWKPKVLAIGGVFGLVGGLLAAFLLVKKAESEDKEPEFSAADVFKIAMLVLVTVSRVTKLGTD